MRCIIAGTALLAIVFALSGATIQEAVATGIVDHFDDGVIDPALWATHVYVTGGGAGEWQYSFSEGTDLGGYLQARVWGPDSASGVTTGLETDVLSTTNFNTGESWLVNFTWSTSIDASRNGAAFSISVVDSLSPPNIPDGAYWIRGDYRTGFTQLWREWQETTSQPAGDTPYAPFAEQEWSIVFRPNGSATLYEAPDATGAPYRTVALSLSEAWYLGFFMPDFNSGTGNGDNSFRLHEYSAVSPVPEPVSVMMLGAIGAGIWAARRTRHTVEK